MILRIIFIFLTVFYLSACVDQPAAPIEYGSKFSHSHSTINTVSSSLGNDEGVIIRRDIEEIKEPQKISGSLEDDEDIIAIPKHEDNNKTIYHEVQDDETLESIAANYGQNTEEIVRLNNLTRPYNLEYGQIIKIQVSNKFLNKKDIKGNFISPVEGKVIIAFGEETIHGKSKGVDIAANEGSNVKSISSGKVIFAGNNKQFGNLIIVKLDSDDLYVAYANLKDLLPAQDKIVVKGEIIGHVGRNNNTGESQLHLAMRKGKIAVDPNEYLPLTK